MFSSESYIRILCLPGYIKSVFHIKEHCTPSFIVIEYREEEGREEVVAWQRAGKGWASQPKVEGAIRYFLKGLYVVQRP